MFFDMPGSNAGPSAVSSVFGRTGAVTAASGDYTVSQITGAAPLASPTFTGTVTEPVPTLPSQTANYFFAAPNGSAGAPSFRAIVASDVPTLNQNTTGTAANLSGTPALPNGTTATTQAAGDNSTKIATTAYVRAEMNALAWSCPISGFTSTVSSCGWTAPAGITITGFDLYAGTAATGCTTYPVLEIYDGTSSAEVGSFAITMTSGTNGYTQVTGSTAFTAGHILRIKTATAGAGCTGPSNVVATITYQMTN
jgi:hypothetical protein